MNKNYYGNYEIDKMIDSSNVVVCNECSSNNLKSVVTSEGSTTTLMAIQEYYDEFGKRHNHNSNNEDVRFKCSNGHSFSMRRINGCWCGWKQK
jgi:hypothetical protein